MPLTAMRKRILAVDGDTTAQSVLLHVLGSLGYDAVPAFDGPEAIARLRTESFELCMTDIDLPGPDIPRTDGYAVLKEAVQQQPPIPVVMLRAEATVSDAVSAVRAGAVNFLPKPAQRGAVEEVLRRILEAPPGARGSGRPVALSHTPAALIGEHPSIRALLQQMTRVADTDASVLIRGETGTGKEVVARARSTARAAAPRGPVRRRQLRRHPRDRSPRASCSATCAAPSRAPTGRARAASSPRTAARCSSTRSARCRAACRRSCCACCRSAR